MVAVYSNQSKARQIFLIINVVIYHLSPCWPTMTMAIRSFCFKSIKLGFIVSVFDIFMCLLLHVQFVCVVLFLLSCAGVSLGQDTHGKEFYLLVK